MPNLDGSEKDAKISDSAYSICSNSQSRRSHSSKSTHSGSHSSVSSGYGGKPSTSDSGSKIMAISKQEKEKKRKWAFEKPALLECRPPEPIAPKEKKNRNEEKHEDMDVTPPNSMPEITDENMSVPMKKGAKTKEISDTQTTMMEVVTPHSRELEGFSCAISMTDGVVMYTTQNISTNLGFPKDMWIGRSFIEFVHPLDRETFASQITKSLAIPNTLKAVATHHEDKSQPTDVQECRMACRIRRYRALGVGFATANRAVSYIPFVLKISFKEIKDDNGSMVYLIIKATPLYPAYKSPSELIMNPTPFVIRHSATGSLEYIDIESVPYLGYLPQDVHNQDALMMYHPDDLPILKIAYETIVKQGGLAKSQPYRMLTQNGDYVKLETEWTSFTNPWSMKLEFVIGKHYVLEGPVTPDVFKAPPPPPDKAPKITDEEKQKIEAANLNKDQILTILKEMLTKPAENAKEQITKRAQEIATIIETLLDEPKVTEELRIDTQDGDIEQDSVMLGGISPHHEYKDSISSTATPMSYNQLNYNENLQRYFDSHLNFHYDASSPSSLVAGDSASVMIEKKLMVDAVAASRSRLSPMALHSTDSLDISPPSSMNSSSVPAHSEFPSTRLTESLLIKHNNEMEKELAKIHREGRSANKANRTSDNRQKTKEHLARCNAKYQGTGGVEESHALKRPLKNIESEIPAKQPCLLKATIDLASPHHLLSAKNIGIPVPIYYPQTVAPVSPQVEKPTSMAAAHIAQNLAYPQISHLNYQPTHMPWTYPQPVYGCTGYMYPPMGLSMQQQNQLMIAKTNEARASPINLTVNKPATLMSETEEAVPSISFKITEPEPEPKPAPEPPKPAVVKEVEKPTGPSDEDNMNRTDEESSYSSFYSSFLRTESGSIRSSEPKKARMELSNKEVEASYTYEPMRAKKTPLKDMNPPWSGQANAAPNLQYKYQVPMKTKGDALNDLTEKTSQISQSCLVNDQLGQLYMDLHLEGVTSRLTLEEGITSSSSSGESSAIGLKAQGRKREYTKLSMIYEENAPLPSPSVSEAPVGPSPAPSDMESST